MRDTSFNDILRVPLNHPEHRWQNTCYKAIVEGENFQKLKENYGTVIGKYSIEEIGYPNLRSSLLRCITGKVGLETDTLKVEVLLY